MNAKTVVQLLAITCLITCRALAISIPPSGCYECEEEVWEEIPCDDIPKNCTTTTTTTTTTTSTTTTSTTTPNPITTTTEDPYKQCYCECKVGCKEFCRKVVVNPEPKKKILQVSKITEPISQGRLESTHYHQRELIPKKSYSSGYRSNNVPKSKSYDSNKSYESHRPPYDSYKTYDSYKSYDSNKYVAPATPTPPRHYNNVPSTSAYYSSSLGAGARAKAQVGATSLGHDQSYGGYDFSIPFSNSYSQLTKTLQDSLGSNNVKVSVATSNSIPRVLNSPYSSPKPVKSAETESLLSLGNYDSVESYIKDIMQGSPSTNYESYAAHGGQHYSMAFR